MKSSPLDTRKVRITVEYEFTTYNEQLDEELVHNLLENEPVTHVLSLLGSGTGLEWQNCRSKTAVSVDKLE